MSDQTAARYRRFAEVEAHGRSALYEAFALGVASDTFALEFLAALPDEKRQPNLLFAALRHVCGTPRDWPQFRSLLREHADEIRATMRARRTQTNEPGRCAVLLPLLARLPQPLALIEVGAAAGLCLLPDRYGYDYGDQQVPPPTPDAPIFPCQTKPPMPSPIAHPQVAWRLGLDLNPIDVADASQRAWLETLVWPEQTDRLQRLRAAMMIARQAQPAIERGDLREDLAACVQRAPAPASIVIFHTAVLAYIADAAQRERFAEAVRALGVVWISNEAPGVFSSMRNRLSQHGPRGAFLLSLNGEPVAWTDPHGAWITWIAT